MLKRTFAKSGLSGGYKTPIKKRRQIQRARRPSSRGVQQQLIGKSSFNEVKCRDQVFTPGVDLPVIETQALIYVEPTVAGLGLATGYTCINCCSQGNGISQRIGNKIVIRNIRIKGAIEANDAQDLTDTGNVRLVIVYDKQTNGAAPAYTNILESIDTAGGTSTMFNSSIKISNKNRFVVLRDEVFSFDGVGGKGTYHFDYFIKKKLEVVFSSTASPPTVANISTGAIYLLVFAETDAFTHVPIIRDVNVRMRYDD